MVLLTRVFKLVDWSVDRREDREGPIVTKNILPVFKDYSVLNIPLGTLIVGIRSVYYFVVFFRCKSNSLSYYSRRRIDEKKCSSILRH